VSEFPERLELEADGRRTVYVLRPDLYAVHDWDGAGNPVDAMAEARVAAFEGDPGGKRPVYAFGTLLAYPTGTVWIRFADGIDASTRTTDLKNAGFHIESSPSYAPNGAYVAADDVATALARLDDLRAVEGVEIVEPQMLVRASNR
jgi:hypothetical protein